MIQSAHRWAAVTMLVTVALCAVGCSTTDRGAAAPSAAVLSPIPPSVSPPSPQPPSPLPPSPILPSPLNRNALGSSIDDATTSPNPTSRPVVSPPRQVVIPSIDVLAPIIDLGLTSEGALETPVDFDMAGWWAGGTVADEAGPTVIVGHVDDQNGPAVFFRLQELEPGDPIIVIDDLGREQTFTVVDKGLYDKDSFPTERVYGMSDTPTLRLVTCGGEFDSAEGSYESNWIVYATAG